MSLNWEAQRFVLSSHNLYDFGVVVFAIIVIFSIRFVVVFVMVVVFHVNTAATFDQILASFDMIIDMYCKVSLIKILVELNSLPI